jgi:hypothetical protein
MTKRVGYGYYPWVWKYAHTLPMWVRNPRVPVPVDKIAILSADLSSDYSSSVPWRTRSHLPPGGDTHNITRNLEVEFNEVDILPKTREAAIMATAAYIAANAPNDDERMWHLQSLVLEGIRVLQSTNEQGHDTTLL